MAKKHTKTQSEIYEEASYLIRYLDPELLIVCLNALNGQPDLANKLRSYRGKLSTGDIEKREVVFDVLDKYVPLLERPWIFALRGAIEYQLELIDQLRERAKHTTPEQPLELPVEMRNPRGMGYYEIKYIPRPKRTYGPYLYYRHQEGDSKGSKYVTNLAGLGRKRKVFK